MLLELSCWDSCTIIVHGTAMSCFSTLYPILVLYHTRNVLALTYMTFPIMHSIISRQSPWDNAIPNLRSVCLAKLGQWEITVQIVATVSCFMGPSCLHNGCTIRERPWRRQHASQRAIGWPPRCHRKSDSPTLRYPRIEFPRIFGIRIPNILRICDIPDGIPSQNLAPPVLLSLTSFDA